MNAVYMDVETILFGILADDAGVTAVLGENPPRIYASIVPMGMDNMPYAVINTGSIKELYRTPTPELDVVYGVTIYADNRAEAHTVQGAIHEAIMMSNFPMSGYGCYAVTWLGARVGTSQEAGRVVWSVTGEYRVRWVKT